MAVQQFPVVKADIASSSNPSLPGRLGPFASRMFGWLNTCRSYFAAAAIYNEMCGLSPQRRLFALMRMLAMKTIGT